MRSRNVEKNSGASERNSSALPEGEQWDLLEESLHCSANAMNILRPSAERSVSSSVADGGGGSSDDWVWHWICLMTDRLDYWSAFFKFIDTKNTLAVVAIPGGLGLHLHWSSRGHSIIEHTAESQNSRLMGLFQWSFHLRITSLSNSWGRLWCQVTTWGWRPVLFSLN